MSFALNIGKNTKPPKTQVFARPKLGFSGLEKGRITRVPRFGETQVYNRTSDYSNLSTR